MLCFGWVAIRKTKENERTAHFNRSRTLYQMNTLSWSMGLSLLSLILYLQIHHDRQRRPRPSVPDLPKDPGGRPGSPTPHAPSPPGTASVGRLLGQAAQGLWIHVGWAPVQAVSRDVSGTVQAADPHWGWPRLDGGVSREWGGREEQGNCYG